MTGDERSARLVRVLLQIPVTVPVEAINDQEAREVALERLAEEGVTPQVIQAALDDPAAQMHVTAIGEHTGALPPMDLPIEYDAPRVR